MENSSVILMHLVFSGLRSSLPSVAQFCNMFLLQIGKWLTEYITVRSQFWVDFDGLTMNSHQMISYCNFTGYPLSLGPWQRKGSCGWHLHSHYFLDGMRWLRIRYEYGNQRDFSLSGMPIKLSTFINTLQRWTWSDVWNLSNPDHGNMLRLPCHRGQSEGCHAK